MDSPVLFGLSSVLSRLSFSVSPISISWLFHTSQLSWSSHLVLSLMFSLSCPGRSVFSVAFFFCLFLLAVLSWLSRPTYHVQPILFRYSYIVRHGIPCRKFTSFRGIPGIQHTKFLGTNPFLPKKFVFHLLKPPSVGYIYSKIRPHTGQVLGIGWRRGGAGKGIVKKHWQINLLSPNPRLQTYCMHRLDNLSNLPRYWLLSWSRVASILAKGVGLLSVVDRSG
jgi:hypothetical protein